MNKSFSLFSILIIILLISIIYYVFTFYLSSCSSDNYRLLSRDESNQLLNISSTQINKKYLLGAEGPSEYDCSGLIRFSFKLMLGFDYQFKDYEGNKIPSVSIDCLFQNNIKEIQPDDLYPGDLVFITSSINKITHGGLFTQWISKTQFCFINASSFYGKVVIDTFPINKIKRSQWFVSFGRLKIFSKE